MDFLETALIAVMPIIPIVLYFLPTIMVYRMKKRKNRRAIVTLNVVGGWTVIGWIAALVWAMSED